MKYIRNSIAPGLFRAIALNQNRKIKNYKIFENRATYQSLDKNPPDEDMCIGLVWPQIKFDHWRDKEKYNFFNAKQDIDLFLDFKLKWLEITSEEFGWLQFVCREVVPRKDRFIISQ